jgi:hypothetical protein
MWRVNKDFLLPNLPNRNSPNKYNISNKSKCCMLYQNNQQCRVILKEKEIPIGTTQVIATYGMGTQVGI